MQKISILNNPSLKDSLIDCLVNEYDFDYEVVSDKPTITLFEWLRAEISRNTKKEGK